MGPPGKYPLTWCLTRVLGLATVTTVPFIEPGTAPLQVHPCRSGCARSAPEGSWARLSAERQHTMRFGSTAKVLAKCKLKYYRISECSRPSFLLIWRVRTWSLFNKMCVGLLTQAEQPCLAISGWARSGLHGGRERWRGWGGRGGGGGPLQDQNARCQL